MLDAITKLAETIKGLKPIHCVTLVLVVVVPSISLIIHAL